MSTHTSLVFVLKLIIDQGFVIFSKNLLSGVGLAGSFIVSELTTVESALYLFLKTDGDMPKEAAASIMFESLSSKALCRTSSLCASRKLTAVSGGWYFFTPIIERKAFLLSLLVPVQAPFLISLLS